MLLDTFICMMLGNPKPEYCCFFLTKKTEVSVFVEFLAFSSMSLSGDGIYLYGTCTDNRFDFRCFNIGRLCRLETNGSRNVDFFSCNSFSCSSFYVNCDVSPDDKYVLTGSSASGVHIWDQANKLCHIYSSHNSEVSAVAWSKTNPSIVRLKAIIPTQ